MEDQLDTFTDPGFINAQKIYSNGGHSKSYAALTLSSPLTQLIPIETVITGTNEEGIVVNGEVYDDDAVVGATVLNIRYVVSASQASYTECHVGGLTVTNTVGCKCLVSFIYFCLCYSNIICSVLSNYNHVPFIAIVYKGLKAVGNVTAGSLALSLLYTSSENKNGRSLQGFSTGANKKMRHDEDETKEFYPDFQKVWR